MKRITLLALGAFLAGLGSCKKDDNNTTTPTPARKDLIVGNWTLSQLGADNNSNNSADLGETAPVGTMGFSGTMSFSSNMTGSYNLNLIDTSTGSFSWYLTNNDNSLIQVEAGDTTRLEILELSSSKATFLQKDVSPSIITIFTK